MLEATLFPATHILAVSGVDVGETAEMEPSVDEIQGEFGRESVPVGPAVFASEGRGGANLAAESGLRVSLEGDDVRGFRVVVELEVELGMNVLGKEDDGKFPLRSVKPWNCVQAEEEFLDGLVCEVQSGAVVAD